MSRPRSGSPRYRRFPWEEPGFDPHKVVAELDGGPSDRNHRSRGDPEEHWDYFGEDMHRDAQRRSPPYSEDRPFGRQRHQNQEEFYHRRSSPNHHMMGFNDDRGLSPLRDGGGGGGNEDRRRDELFQGYENRERSSPPRLAREKLPPTPRSHSHQRESGMGWRREEQGRGRGRFRDLSPGERLDDQRVGAGRERGRRTTQGMNTDPRRGEEAHEERNPPFKRQRRETDGAAHLGYRNEEDFGGQRYSVDSPRDRFGGGAQSGLPRGEARRSGPVVIEHDHGIRDVPRWEQFRARGGHEPHFSRQRSPRPMASSSSSSPQERFRTPDSRLDEQEDGRGRQFQDNWRESGYNENRRNPAPQDRLNPVRHSSRGGPMNHRGRGGPRPGRGQLHRGQGGRTRPPRTQQRLQPSSQGYQDEEERPGYRPHREDRYKDPNDAGEPDWAEEDRLQQWEPRKTGSLDHQLQRADLNPKIPRQREWGWSDQKSDDVTVVTEETLTIKVDMSRPVNKNSSLCYSSDRQLSLDLVNVGRQRLDFLPMLEHSGTYRETAMHTGTFAQEIITLVHHVKEQYFRDDGATLNERFSAPQKGGNYSEEELEELTLDERFTSNRGFSLNMNSLLDDEEPLFSRLGALQPPVRGPGDLRHDLERRRQERLEGVKVTISGNSVSQHHLGPASESGLDYDDQDDELQMEDEGFSNWPDEQIRRREGNMGVRRGAPFTSQRRNTRPFHRLGPMRRPNNRSNHTGPTW